jgi:hypothetical protein
MDPGMPWNRRNPWTRTIWEALGDPWNTWLMRHGALKRADQVFGISNEVLPDSYVDRGELDEELAKLLNRRVHVALRGHSKSGKSWLRQRVLRDSLNVQCRLGMSVVDIYRDALSQLGIRLETTSSAGSGLVGRAEASGEVGLGLFAKLGIRSSVERQSSDQTTSQPVGHDVTDLRFVADLIRASERRLVVEDFHYLSIGERQSLAFDLKALWDYGVFVVIVGVWSQQNMILYLNPDLTGRVTEVSIVWSAYDLRRVFERGGEALNLVFGDELVSKTIADSYGNVGILQNLILGTLDELGIREAQVSAVSVDSLDALNASAMAYADQLNPLYLLFAERVAGGIRKRKDTTGIYPHAMAAVLEAPDADLLAGVELDHIYDVAHARQPRIQKANLKTILENIQALQVDEAGRGLILAYNEVNRTVSVVDPQLLLYRRYSTVKWPWEDLIKELAGEQT